MRLRLAILGVLLSSLLSHSAAAQPRAKNVLIIFSYFNHENGPFLISIESSLRARVSEKINFDITYPEFWRFNDKDFRESQAETFRREYDRVRPDLVIAVSYPAFEFTVQYRDRMFPGVPIVVTGIGPGRLEIQRWPGVTGVVTPLGLRETVDLALHLHPDTKAVAVIAESQDFWWASAHSEILRYQDRVKEIDIIGSPDSRMLATVAALPPHTVALFQMFASDTAQPAVGVNEVLDTVAQHVPTYSAWPRLGLGHGGVGGVYHDPTKTGLAVGEISARVLSGERPDDIPIVRESGLQVQTDWRQLHRWHVPESALPSGSVILYREPTLWERDRKYIVPAMALIAAQVLLIAGLVWQRSRKRNAEAVLRESEERFRVMADTTPSLIWICDAQGRITYLNETWAAFTGADPNAGCGDLWVAYIHPDDRKNVSDTLSRALNSHDRYSQEFRLRRSDGAYGWILSIASPRMNGDGSFAGFIGSAIDTTDQKLAQHALEKVSGQLIEAQDNERARIARELHDDICQRLALLSMELERANRGSNGSSMGTNKNLEEIRKHCAEIADDVQSLSHQLHSSKLDYLGLVAAIRGFCREFSEQHDVSVEFIEKSVPQYLPQDISLCFFRVVQEALHNAVKYSGVSEFAVELIGTTSELQLVVSDAGIGFDVEAAKKNSGLGLVSMQERVHLVHGRFSVESKLYQGTKIVAVVPLVGERGFSSKDDTEVERMKETV